MCMNHIRLSPVWSETPSDVIGFFKCVLLQKKSLFVAHEVCGFVCVCVICGFLCVCVMCVCVCVKPRLPSVDTEGLSCSPLWRWLGNSSRQPLGSDSFILCLWVCENELCVWVCAHVCSYMPWCPTQTSSCWLAATNFTQKKSTDDRRLSFCDVEWIQMWM